MTAKQPDRGKCPYRRSRGTALGEVRYEQGQENRLTRETEYCGQYIYGDTVHDNCNRIKELNRRRMSRNGVTPETEKVPLQLAITRMRWQAHIGEIEVTTVMRSGTCEVTEMQRIPMMVSGVPAE